MYLEQQKESVLRLVYLIWYYLSIHGRNESANKKSPTPKGIRLFHYLPCDKLPYPQDCSCDCDNIRHFGNNCTQAFPHETTTLLSFLASPSRKRKTKLCLKEEIAKKNDCAKNFEGSAVYILLQAFPFVNSFLSARSLKRSSARLVIGRSLVQIQPGANLGCSYNG